MNKNTEWKKIQLSKEVIDFTQAKNAHLEVEFDDLISLTLTLKDGKLVRIRKANYGVTVETPVIQMDTLFVVKVGQLTQNFKTRSEAETALGNLEGEIDEIQIPRQTALPLQADDFISSF